MVIVVLGIAGLAVPDGPVGGPAEGPAHRSPVLEAVVPRTADQLGRDQALTLEVEQMGGPGDDHPQEGSAGPVSGAKCRSRPAKPGT